MTDKEYQKEKERIRRLAKKWITPIGLGWWHIDIKYYREKDDYKAEDGGETVMSVEPDWKYLTATIHVHLPMTQTMNDSRLEWAFVHELCHIFVNPMSTKEKGEQEEFVVTVLAKALVWASKNIKNEKKLHRNTNKQTV